ncbi:MAG TPA: OmpA family protein [Planctomycetota bacterium]|jgi:chemotaxis protein MotB|nr:OmpA family protein [Planctomycetota bacterium]
MTSRRGVLPGAAGAPVRDEDQIRWLISYSDFMMQLVCLFILLYAAAFVGRSRERARPPEPPALLRELEPILRRLPEGGRIRILPEAGGFRVRPGAALFAEGGEELTAEGKALVDAAAALVAPFAGRAEELEVVGHAAPGEPEAERLSRARARKAWEWATRAGAPGRLPGGRLRAAGRGAHEPSADGLDPAARALNRRVEFVVRWGASSDQTR